MTARPGARGIPLDAGLAVLAGLVLLALGAAWLRDAALPLRGLAATGRLLRSVWIELALGFLLAGLLEVLLSGETIARWLGPGSAGRGLLAAWAAGLLAPGGPYVVFPVAANLYRHGAAPGPLITFISAKVLVSPVRTLTYEVPLLGWPLTLARVVPGLLLPPVLGVVGEWLFGVLRRG